MERRRCGVCPFPLALLPPEVLQLPLEVRNSVSSFCSELMKVGLASSAAPLVAAALLACSGPQQALVGNAAVVPSGLPFQTLARAQPQAAPAPEELSQKVLDYQQAFPAKAGDPVVLVTGEEKGNKALLIETEGKYGIIKLTDSGSIKAVEYSALVKGIASK